MIKGITQSGRYLQVTGGSSSSTYVNNYSGQPGVGNMRFNPSTQNIEVYDGTSWIMMASTFSTIGLNHEAETLLDWAREKRNEELAWQSLANGNEAVKIALKNFEEARRQLDITAKLARDYDKETTS